MSNNGDNIKKVAIYTRVSTEDQAKEGFSLDAQLEKLKAFCLSKDLQISGIYVDDGYSGRTIKRPFYQKMFEDMDQWEGILVLKMDRIHRNRLNFIEMMKELRKQEKDFVSMTENLDTSTAIGRFVMGIIQDIAQLESEQIGERTFTGMYQKAKDPNSGFNGHWCPFGYKVDEADGIFKEDPEKIQLVKIGFKLADEGKTIGAISRKLGLKYSTVHYFLHNPFYAGFERWTDKLKKTSVEPIISRKKFNQIQKKITKRIQRSDVRKAPLQLPLDKDIEVFELPKDDIKQITSIRFDRFKHPTGA